MNIDTIISIKPEPDKKARRKGIPGRRDDDTWRRRLNFPAIQFYDLAQVNTGTTETPIWEDHPILKVPGYVISQDPVEGGAIYTIDPFLESDHLAFTDRLFDIGPVTEWKHLFKHLTFEENPDYPGPFDTSVSSPATYPTDLFIKAQSGVVGTYPFDASWQWPFVFNGTTTPSERTAMLDAVKMAWNTRGLEYRDIDDLTITTTLRGSRQWFPSSTGLKSTYKVTSVYDSSASDVGDIAISGNIDVYLVPQIGMFFGASNGGPHHTAGSDSRFGVDVIGPWYQVLPRANWPAYVDPYELADQELLKSAYLAYQAGRTDAIASHWAATSDFSALITSTMDPVDFAVGNFTWKVFCNTSNGVTLYGGNEEVLRLSAGASSSAYMYCEAPFLMAVMKIHGQFYYVWCLDGAGDNNLAATEGNSLGGYDLSVYDPALDYAP